MQIPLSFEPDSAQPDQEIEQAPDDEEADRQFIDKLRSVHNFADREDFNHAPESLFQPSQRREAPIENELVQQILANGEAEGMLDEYRQMSVSFPFVVLPPQLSASMLHANKPMLFLAVLTIASWRDHRRQMSLDSTYRSELANRTIIRPRRTLGLVQSVLVYLSWYVVPFYS